MIKFSLKRDVSCSVNWPFYILLMEVYLLLVAIITSTVCLLIGVVTFTIALLKTNKEKTGNSK